MKRLLSMAMCLTAIASSVNLNAQIDNLSNLSPEWIRSGARNASLNSVDAVVYNPAGLSQLSEGWHAGIGNQFFFRSPSHSYDLGYGMVTHRQQGNDWLVPNLYAAYRKGKMTGFGGVCIAGGGATAHYPQGSINTTLISMQALMLSEDAYQNWHSAYFKASSYYLSPLAGISLTLNENLSLSASVRFIQARNKIEAGITLTQSPVDLPDLPLSVRTQSQAAGTGIIIGLNHMFNEKANVMIRYESRVKLNFTNDTQQDDLGLFPDGEKSARDLSAVLATGAGIQLSEKVRLQAEYNHYFQSRADWGMTLTEKGEMPVATLAGDASAYGLSAEYQMSGKLLLSAGMVYTQLHFSDKAGYYTVAGAFETVPGNNLSVNTGFCYSVTHKVRLNVGIAKIFWKKDESILIKNLLPAEIPAVVNNSMTAAGIGINFSF
jgi:long-subunit fatty acid transport protein